jgi:dolichol-phosphate mannosyltransferase
MKREILIIIPTYNEAENLETVVAQTLDQKINNLNILVVDDNSPDGTGKIADRLEKKHLNYVYAIHNRAKGGLGTAYLRGFRWAKEQGYSFVGEMDADGSHDSSCLKTMIEESRKGADLVMASRRVKGGQIIGWGWHRHLISWGATALTRVLLGLPYKDITAGFRIYNRRAIDLLLNSDIKSNGYAFQEETLWKIHQAGMTVKEVPTIFTDRKYGESKLGSKDSIEFFKILLSIRTKRG